MLVRTLSGGVVIPAAEPSLAPCGLSRPAQLRSPSTPHRTHLASSNSQNLCAEVLDFALKLEKQVPAAAEISVGQTGGAITPTEQANVKHLTQQTFYGDVTNILADSGSAVTLNVIKGDTSSLAKALEEAGIPSDEAKELAEIAGQEAPQNEM